MNWRETKSRSNAITYGLGLLVGVLGPAAAACSSGPDIAPPPSDPSEEDEQQTPVLECPDDDDSVLCAGQWAVYCSGKGEPDKTINCFESDQVCAPRLGCRVCVPARRTCGDSNQVVECDAEGSEYIEVEPCDAEAGEHCNLASGRCENLCQTAIAANSYIGCEYWAAPLINSQLLNLSASGEAEIPFAFAVVIANPQAVPAEVAVERGGQLVREQVVGAGGLEVVELDWIPALAGEPAETQHSAKVADGAYRIQSNVPVTVYQFNPLQFREEIGGENVFTHSNDASLLLPVNTLTGNYRVMSRPTLVNRRTALDSSCGGDGQIACPEPQISSTPGFVAVIGVQQSATEVQITAAGHTEPTADGSVPALGPGESYTVTLQKGEVLQLVSATPVDCLATTPADRTSAVLCSDDPESGQEECDLLLVDFDYCEVGADYDLTGSAISASGPVAVLSGHDCDFVPFNRWACDHIEESMFPLEAWGKDIFIALSQPVRSEPNVVRVMSASDDNSVRFTPAVHQAVTLDAGEYLEFEAQKDFRVEGNKAIMVAQFLVGQNYEGYGRAAPLSAGDPAMSLGIPLEQWRNRYTFLAPETFPDNYVNLIAAGDPQITLDGKLVGGWQQIEGDYLSVARIEIDGGQHTVEAVSPFGIVVYGYAIYTSYMYPGGLDLNPINIL